MSSSAGVGWLGLSPRQYSNDPNPVSSTKASSSTFRTGANALGRRGQRSNTRAGLRIPALQARSSARLRSRLESSPTPNEACLRTVRGGERPVRAFDAAKASVMTAASVGKGVSATTGGDKVEAAGTGTGPALRVAVMRKRA